MKMPRSARESADPAYGHCAKRLSITEAAEAVFASEGFAAASIDMIAAKACVSRQTIYNHYGDKANLFVAVVRDLTERSNAGLFHLIASFPAEPVDLEAELADFGYRMMANCICNRESKALRRLIEAEGGRSPDLFASWREEGPGKAAELIGSRLLALDRAGWLSIDDPVLAARQFVALVNADIEMIRIFGGSPSEAEMKSAARNGVRTFLAAFGAKTKARPRPAIASLAPAEHGG